MTTQKANGNGDYMGGRITSSIRDMSPCNGCTEKFTACHDNCPKDARGEPGYKAWKAEIERVNKERQTYLERMLGGRYYIYGGHTNG